MRIRRLLLSLLAMTTGLLAWQHLEGIGLGDRTQRGLSSTPTPGEESLYGA